MDNNKWRNVGRRLTVFGVPVPSLFIFMLLFPFPSMTTFYSCIGVIGFYILLAWKGYTLTVLVQSILRLIRGRKATGRPWWYRRYQR